MYYVDSCFTVISHAATPNSPKAQLNPIVLVSNVLSAKLKVDKIDGLRHRPFFGRYSFLKSSNRNLVQTNGNR
jgi:hypothetical protein